MRQRYVVTDAMRERFPWRDVRRWIAAGDVVIPLNFDPDDCPGDTDNYQWLTVAKDREASAIHDVTIEWGSCNSGTVRHETHTLAWFRANVAYLDHLIDGGEES